MRGLFLILFLFISKNLPAVNIQQAGSGCPDATCIWAIGQDFGTRPAVKISTQSREWTIPFRDLTFRTENNIHSISFGLKTADQIIAMDTKGLTVQIINNQTLQTSNALIVERLGLPPFNKIIHEPLIPYEAGGTNYAVSNLGNATPQDPFKDIQLVIPYYHENPEFVHNTLYRMYQNGQRKLALVIWYHVQELPDCRYSIVVSIVDGDLCAQHKQNIKDILLYAKNIGFNEVFIRFANYGNVVVGEWPTVDEYIFNQVNSMIHNVRNDIEDFFYGTTLKRTYDLCLECGGQTGGSYPEFVRRLYQNYVQSFGNQDTIGVSFAYYPGRIKHFFKMLDQYSLPRPKEIGVDIYKTDDGDFYRIKQELISLEESQIPVVLLETFYNNGETATAVYNARFQSNLQVRTIFQWQLPQGGMLFDPPEPVDFAAYTSLMNKPVAFNWNAYTFNAQTTLSAMISPRNKYVKAEFYSADGLEEFLGQTTDLREIKGPYYYKQVHYRIAIPESILQTNLDRRLKVRVFSKEGVPTELNLVPY